MSKQAAYEKLIKEYTNKNGHTTLKRAILSDPTSGNYDSENPNLFTGEAGILVKLNGLDPAPYIRNAAKSIMSVMVLDEEGREIKGLFSRQPGSYNSKNVVSHDEYSGYCFTACAVPQFRNSIISDIVEYGKKYGYCYDDTNPQVNPVAQLKYNIKLWFQLFCVAFLKHDREKYPLVNTLTHRRQPDEVAFYKMISDKHKPSLFGVFYFALSLILSVRKPKGSTSGKIINWNKLKALEIIGYKSFMVKVASKYFYKRLNKDYGENYVSELYKIYFRDPMHPFHELVKGLK
jgi:hypothetical protein